MTLGGGPSNAHWTAEWQNLNDRQRWLRLMILEGQRTGGERVANFVAELLKQSEGMPAALRFQALRTLAAMPAQPSQPVEVQAWNELVEWSFRRRQVTPLARLMNALELDPEREGQADQRRVLLFYLEVALLKRDVAAAVQECLLLGEIAGSRGRADLIDQLERARFQSGPLLVREVAQESLAQARGQAAEWLEEAFMLSGSRVERPAEDQLPREDLTPADFGRLGAWAGLRGGAEALSILLASVA